MEMSSSSSMTCRNVVLLLCLLIVTLSRTQAAASSSLDAGQIGSEPQGFYQVIQVPDPYHGAIVLDAPNSNGTLQLAIEYKRRAHHAPQCAFVDLTINEAPIPLGKHSGDAASTTSDAISLWDKDNGILRDYSVATQYTCKPAGKAKLDIVPYKYGERITIQLQAVTNAESLAQNLSDSDPQPDNSFEPETIEVVLQYDYDTLSYNAGIQGQSPLQRMHSITYTWKDTMDYNDNPIAKRDSDLERKTRLETETHNLQRMMVVLETYVQAIAAQQEVVLDLAAQNGTIFSNQDATNSTILPPPDPSTLKRRNANSYTSERLHEVVTRATSQLDAHHSTQGHEDAVEGSLLYQIKDGKHFWTTVEHSVDVVFRRPAAKEGGILDEYVVSGSRNTAVVIVVGAFAFFVVTVLLLTLTLQSKQGDLKCLDLVRQVWQHIMHRRQQVVQKSVSLSANVLPQHWRQKREKEAQALQLQECWRDWASRKTRRRRDDLTLAQFPQLRAPEVGPDRRVIPGGVRYEDEASRLSDVSTDDARRHSDASSLPPYTSKEVARRPPSFESSARCSTEQQEWPRSIANDGTSIRSWTAQSSIIVLTPRRLSIDTAWLREDAATAKPRLHDDTRPVHDHDDGTPVDDDDEGRVMNEVV